MRIEARGIEEVGDRFDAIAARLADPEPVMRLVRADAERHLAEQTRAGRDANDTPWAPFDEDTLRQGGGGSVLEQLAASMVERSLGGASFSIGSTAAYAHFWERGTKHMPARPFLPAADSEVVNRWVGWIENYVAHGELP